MSRALGGRPPRSHPPVSPSPPAHLYVQPLRDGRHCVLQRSDFVDEAPRQLLQLGGGLELVIVQHADFKALRGRGEGAGYTEGGQAGDRRSEPATKA